MAVDLELTPRPSGPRAGRVVSRGSAIGESTQMAFEVECLEATLADLQARGVSFERFEMAGFDVRGRGGAPSPVRRIVPLFEDRPSSPHARRPGPPGDETPIPRVCDTGARLTFGLLAAAVRLQRLQERSGGRRWAAV